MSESKQAYGTLGSFDSANATVREIRERAALLEGVRLADLGTGLDLSAPSSSRTKSVVGDVYEAYFGIRKNSLSEPDFRKAGIELKSTPVRVKQDGRFGQKERISLRMLGTASLANQAWATAELRHKLDLILIIFYRWERERAIGSFVTLKSILWSPDRQEEELLRADWEFVRNRVVSRLPLSESQTHVLAAATKGSRNSSTRGWALKAPFVFAIFSKESAAPEYSMLDAFGGRQADFEANVLALTDRYAGRTVSSIRVELGIAPSKSKNAPATIIRSLLGVPPRGRVREFDLYGLDIKTVPISPAGKVWEALSLPAFRVGDLVDETWEDSTLATQLNRLLLVPLVRPRRSTALDEATIGRASFWSPSPDQFATAGSEWRRYRESVVEGRVEDYPRRSDGMVIFVNTHGQDGKDYDKSSARNDFAKRSFWLNPTVVETAIQSIPTWRGY